MSDQTTLLVDVGTGNLRVRNETLALPGVNGSVTIGQTYNSRSSSTGSTLTAAANRWTWDINGAGSLSAGASGKIVYTSGDGATWVFTPVSGSPGAYTAPGGVMADLAASGSNYTITWRKTRTVVTFNADGQATSIADRNGNTTTLTYTGANPTSIVSTAGPTPARTAALSYSSSTFTLTARQTSGTSSRNVKYVKDPYSNLVKITDGNGKDTVFGYTGTQLTSITAPGGAVIGISYKSGTDKVSRISQNNTTAGSPGTSHTRLEYPSATQTLVARPNTNQSASVGSVPHIEYTVNSTSFLVTGSVDEMGRSRGATYTPNGDGATATQGTGGGASTTTATYGANGGDSLTSLQSPTGATISAAYANTAASTKYLPSSTTDSAGNSTTYTYNGAGNPLTSSNALAATGTLTYNSNGTVASALAPGNGTNKTLYGYNGNFQLDSLTPVTGSSLGSRAYTYDDFGRVRTATDGKGVTVTYSYDNQDRLLSTAFTGGTISYGYDLSSNLTSVTDGRGTTTNEFDDSGVATKILYPSGSGVKTLAIATDDKGRRTDVWLDTNSTNTAWKGHTHQDYDASGRVSRATSETVDTNGNPVTVTDVSYCYNTAGTPPTCGTGASTDRAKLQWQRDNLTGQVTSYGYDNGGHLTSATQTGGTSPTTWTYTYDARGNRLTATATGGVSSSQTVTFNAANQVTTTGYSFDGAGNMTADPAGTYTYNGAEQMTGVSNSGGSFAYKYAGTSQVEVLQQQTSTNTYKLVYGRLNQVGQPVIEQAQIGSVTAYVENDPVTGQPLMLRTSTGAVSLYVYDGTGNPTAILRDVTGAGYIYAYDPYGLPTLSYTSGGTGTQQNPFLFKGGIQDRATGWVHFGNRWYNPTTGRWTQQDTLDAPLDPTNANRYAYAGCDPINLSDPTGEATSVSAGCWVAYAGIVLATAGAIIGTAGSGAAFAFGLASYLVAVLGVYYSC